MPSSKIYQPALLFALVAITAALMPALTLSVSSADLDRRCVVASADREVLLGRDYRAFDEAVEDFAWRTLLQKGCVREAVGLLDAYRARNASRMTEEQRLELNFHLGQTLAFSGFDEESFSHFEGARSASAPAEWAAYVDATIAFLRKDRLMLLSARERYAKAAGTQPIRLQIIDGFLKCIERKYAEAVHCAFENDMH